MQPTPLVLAMAQVGLLSPSWQQRATYMSARVFYLERASHTNAIAGVWR
jgi:hypothetical protein